MWIWSIKTPTVAQSKYSLVLFVIWNIPTMW